MFRSVRFGKRIFILSVAISLIAILPGCSSQQKNYNLAESAFNEKDYSKAISYYEAAGDYSDAAEQAENTKKLIHYESGNSAFEQGDFDKAFEEYTEAGDYKDAADKAKESKAAGHYTKAKSLSDDGKYEDAVLEYIKAEGYSDSKEQIFSIYHSLGEKALNGEQYDVALSYFKQANEYKDISEEILNIHYIQGEKCLAAEDYDNAVSFFKEAKNFKDAATRILAIAYTRAELSLKEGDEETAIKFFTEAGEYNDASDRISIIYYNQGSKAVKAKKYEEAIDLYTKSGRYKDAAEQVEALHYLLGTQTLKNGEFETAVTHFSKAGSYKDASDQVLNVFYTQGVQETRKKNYDSAIDLLTKAKSYKNSQDIIANIYCIKANESLANKKYEEAAKTLKLFENAKTTKLLNDTIANLINKRDYENAKTMMAYCDKSVAEGYKYYIEGVKSLDRKDYAIAGNYFSIAGNTMKAKQLSLSCYYAAGSNELKKGNYASAIDCFAKCGKYKNSLHMLNVCRGEEAFQNDDYAHAIYYYRKVPQKLKVSGINIKSRKALMNRIAPFESLKGDYVAIGNTLISKNVFKLFGTSTHWWERKSLQPNQELSLDYTVNSNGTIHLTGYVTFAHYINYYAYSSLLDVKVSKLTINKNGLKKFPTTLKINGATKLKYKKKRFTLTFQTKEYESIYSHNIFKSTVVYAK